MFSWVARACGRQTAGRQTHNSTPGVINIISCVHWQGFIKLGQHYDKSEFLLVMNTVGELLIELSEYDANTLDYALKSLAGEDYERFREVLATIKKDLSVKVTSPQSESKTKNMKTPKQPAPAVVFKEYVVPQMLAGLTKYEINEDKWTSRC